jgi:hypothetical protein
LPIVGRRAAYSPRFAAVKLEHMHLRIAGNPAADSRLP